MSIMTFIWILLIHWFADFVLQTHEEATKKSTCNKALTSHVDTYTGCIAWVIMILYWYNVVPPEALWAIPITYVCHWVTDYYTSRLNSYLYKKGDIHNFFVSVGFDQILHYVQLILCYKYLIWQ